MINSKDIDKLSSDEIFKIYKNNINYGQAKLFAGLSTSKSIPIKAQGNDIYLLNGKIIKDFTGGLGVLNHGHNHKKIINSRIEFQKLENMEVSKLYLSPYVAALSNNIAELFPGNLNYSYFCNSGAEAIEGALKMCHKFFNGSRNLVLSSERAFHGKTLGALSVSNADEITYNFPQLLENVTFEFNNVSSLENKVINSLDLSGNSNIFAILIEPFSASSFSVSSNEFLEAAKKLSVKYSIPLIFDEIYTGFYKTGPLFNFMRSSIVPDIVVYSKSFGGGKSSISGYTFTKKIFDKSYGNTQDALMHSTTYNGFGEEAYTALVSIEVAIEENFEEKSKKINATIQKGLQELKKKHHAIFNFTGMGALFGIELLLPNIYKYLQSLFNFYDEKFFKKLYIGALIDYLYEFENKLLYFTDNKKVHLAISPSLITTEDEINALIISLDNVLSKNQITLVSKFIKNVGKENIKLIFK